MAINITIDPLAYGSGGPLEQFAFKRVPNTYVKTTERLSEALPGFIASAPRLTGSSNILEDGTFPLAEGATGAFEPAELVDTAEDLMVHVSPTSGSSVVRGGSQWNPNTAEYDPTYGLNVSIAGITLQSDVFETALNEPVGMQFRANLQDMVARGILIVRNDGGTPMTPKQIGDYQAP
jgi:hypothetical protein